MQSIVLSMNNLFKERIKWGLVVVAALSVYLFTVEDETTSKDHEMILPWPLSTEAVVAPLFQLLIPDKHKNKEKQFEELISRTISRRSGNTALIM